MSYDAENKSPFESPVLMNGELLRYLIPIPPFD